MGSSSSILFHGKVPSQYEVLISHNFNQDIDTVYNETMKNKENLKKDLFFLTQEDIIKELGNVGFSINFSYDSLYNPKKLLSIIVPVKVIFASGKEVILTVREWLLMIAYCRREHGSQPDDKKGCSDPTVLFLKIKSNMHIRLCK
jgi:hypothetical protein